MRVVGSNPDRESGEEWKDTLNIIAGIPETVVRAVLSLIDTADKKN